MSRTSIPGMWYPGTCNSTGSPQESSTFQWSIPLPATVCDNKRSLILISHSLYVIKSALRGEMCTKTPLLTIKGIPSVVIPGKQYMPPRAVANKQKRPAKRARQRTRASSRLKNRLRVLSTEAHMQRAELKAPKIISIIRLGSWVLRIVSTISFQTSGWTRGGGSGGSSSAKVS